MSRRLCSAALLLASCLAHGCGDSPGDAAPPEKRPHLVLIVADTLRQDYLGAYGFSGEVSGAIDQFARGAILFESGISPSPWTKPSIASILTSVPPEVHGLIDISGLAKKRALQSLNVRIPTLAGELKRAGYETVALYANAWLNPESGLGRGFDRYERFPDDGATLTSLAIQSLATASTDRPLFLYVHYMDPHGPYKCDPKRFRTLRSSPTIGTDRSLSGDEYDDLKYLRKMKTPWLRNSKLRHSLSYWRTCYAAGVAQFDTTIRPLLQQLSQDPRGADTAVVFTSDHGEALLDRHVGAPVGWEHGWNLHFHQTRVPMIVRLPDGRFGGTRVPAAVSGLDVAPTLLELAGVSPPESMQGQSLLAVRRAPEAHAERWVFTSGVKRNPNLVAVENRRYKVIFNLKNDRVLAYDRLADPRETENIAAFIPDLVEELRDRVEGRAHRLGAMDLLPQRAGELDPQTFEELRALGYIAE